jgi:hypothetical protein
MASKVTFHFPKCIAYDAVGQTLSSTYEKEKFSTLWFEGPKISSDDKEGIKIFKIEVQWNSSSLR